MLWVLIRSASLSTHNICFQGEIRKLSVFFFSAEKGALSGAMSSITFISSLSAWTFDCQIKPEKNTPKKKQQLYRVL